MSALRPDSLLTSHQAGSLLQVDPTSIKNWVKAGRIQAFRTPGGHLRIRANDLVSFLKAHDMPIPRGLQQVARRRLLIVDDDPLQLRSLSRLFKPHADRIALELVDNGIDALVRVGIFVPDLLILDVVMPNLDGLEVCRRLKANPLTQSVEVIMTSAQLDDEVIRNAIEAGAKRCMPKPLALDVILDDLGLAGESET